MRAYLLSIGSELILGHLTDTNATFLAQELVAQGIDLLHVTQVGDDFDRLVGAMRHALADADLLICTGGIGPTGDDLTREAIAAVVGQEPVVDPDLLATIQSFFAARGLTMPERNAKQAWLIPAAEALPNPIGTAPGWFVRHDGKLIVAMPGVPREMYRMWREQALPRISATLPPRAIRSITFKTLGIGESAAEQLLIDLVDKPNPVVATYAKDDGVQVRVTAFAAEATEAEGLRDATAALVRERLARHIYAVDDVTLPRALLDLLAGGSLRLACGERGTGGRFGALLAADPAAATAFAGTLVLPEIQPGLSAGQMAALAIETLRAPLGLGLTLDVAPDERGTFSGTATVALAGTHEATDSVQIRAAFEDAQRRAALAAADLLRRALTQG